MIQQALQKVLDGLNNLGSLLRDQGDLDVARAYQERALNIRNRVLRPDHPHTAFSLNSLGVLPRCAQHSAVTHGPLRADRAQTYTAHSTA